MLGPGHPSLHGSVGVSVGSGSSPPWGIISGSESENQVPGPCCLLCPAQPAGPAQRADGPPGRLGSGFSGAGVRGGGLSICSSHCPDPPVPCDEAQAWGVGARSCGFCSQGNSQTPPSWGITVGREEGGRTHHPYRTQLLTPVTNSRSHSHRPPALPPTLVCSPPGSPGGGTGSMNSFPGFRKPHKWCISLLRPESLPQT